MKCDRSGSFQRSTRNLLVLGLGGLPDLGGYAAGLAALQRVIEALRGIVEGRQGQARILTGLGPGVPTETARLANRLGLPLDIIAPCRVPGVDLAGLGAARVALVSDGACAPPDADLVAAAHEAGLSMADALILVGDSLGSVAGGGPASSPVVEAVLRNTPVIRIRADGEIALLDPGRLEAAPLATLAANRRDPGLVAECFAPVKGDLATALAELVATAWDGEKLSWLGRALNCAGTDPGATRTWWGALHTAFFGCFGPWKRKWRAPVLPWRGPQAYQEASQLPAEVWGWFDRVDRAATHSANKHRDEIVLIHLLAILAVFGAVAGKIDLWSVGDLVWTVLEIVTLVWIALLVGINNRRRRNGVTSHDGWLHFRQAAEALRMSAMLHPLLAGLTGLQRGVWGRKGGKIHLDKPYHWLVIQLLRDAGLPDQQKALGLEPRLPALVTALQGLMDDQLAYHQGAAARYRESYHKLHGLTLAVFGIVFAVVLVHLSALGIGFLEGVHIHVPEFLVGFAHCIHDQHWLLIITAVAPALAAGLHGINTKAELHRLAKNSNRMLERLGVFRQAISACAAGGKVMDLRAIALRATSAMYDEHDTWAELMADQELEIPA